MPRKLAPGEKQYVEALEFDVQAETRGGREYQPLVDIRGMPCWPAEPDYRQLKGGAQMRREQRDFESHWDHRKAATLELRVTRDFDFVVLGVGVGALPYVCSEIIASNPRWRRMVDRVKTVATQAFQIWLGADLQELGWDIPPGTLTSFVKPFDTWADMGHVVPAEDWRDHPPRTVAYFCNVLADPPQQPDASDIGYPKRRARRGARQRHPLSQPRHPASMAQGEAALRRVSLGAAGRPRRIEQHGKSRRPRRARFDTQYWTANVNPSDRYVLSLPGSLRISDFAARQHL